MAAEPIINLTTEDNTVAILDSNESRFEAVDGENSENSESEKKDANLVVGDGRLGIVVFLVGLWVRAREGLERAFSELFDWWPFWRQEKRLAKLISDADANPKDAVKQSALFIELNKHRFVCVEFNSKFQICNFEGWFGLNYLSSFIGINIYETR